MGKSSADPSLTGPFEDTTPGAQPSPGGAAREPARLPTPGQLARQFLWNEPPQDPPPGTASARVRRGQVLVAGAGVALWLAGIGPGVMAWPGMVTWCYAGAFVAVVATLVWRPPQDHVLTAVLLATATTALVVTQAGDAASPIAAAWFDATAISLIGMATLRRGLVGLAIVTVTSGVAWSAQVLGPDSVAGGWRSAVVWTVATASLGLTGLLLAAVVRAGARRLDDAAATAAQAVTEDEVAQAERAAFADTARLLHDTVINTLSAIGRGVDDSGREQLRRRCRQDLELIDRTLQDPEQDPVAAALARAGALGLNLQVQGDSETLRQAPQSARDAVAAALGEGLLNISKHAGVAHARLQLRDDQSGVVVELVDTGVGWSGDGPKTGGIAQSIEARCSEAGVQASVSSAPGMGTRVRLRLPVEVGSPREAASFAWEARIMTGVVCGVLLTDMGIRSVLTVGIVPAWGSFLALILLTMVLGWQFTNRPAGQPVTSRGALAMALVGLPVMVLLPPLGGAISWTWWGTLAGLTIFLALVAVNASVWWVVLAYVAQMVGRVIATEPTVDLLFPDALVMAIGALLAVWIRGKVLDLMTGTVALAEQRDRARRESARDMALHRESLARLRAATDRARKPLAAIEQGRVSGTEASVRAEAIALAPYLRDAARIGPGLGELGSALIELLDETWHSPGDITLRVDPRTRPPHPPLTAQLAEFLKSLPPVADRGGSCTITLRALAGERCQLGLLVPGAQVPDVSLLRSREFEVQATPAGEATLIEVAWSV